MDDVFSRGAFIHTDVLGQQIVKDRTIAWKQEFKHYVLIVAALVFFSLLFVWSRLEVVQIGYEISHANMVYQNFNKENQQLRVEVASLKSPSRIEEIAQSRLDLIHPTHEQIIIIP